MSSETYPTQQELLCTIERMDKEIESLQQEMEKVGGSEEQPTSNMAVTPAASGPREKNILEAED